MTPPLVELQRPGRGLELVVDAAARAQVVLLGEATHGTHEFYALRAEITRRLVDEHGFAAVAAEADWPDAFRASCFARGAGNDASADEALSDFRRFPAWMWRNEEVLVFIDWLRAFNERSPGRSVGFYGLDLYSLYGSLEAAVAYLDEVDPAAAARARERYGCFERFEEAQAYGAAAALGGVDACEEDVVAQLVELRRRAAEVAERDGRIEEDRAFSAVQNARVVANAEAYYRSLYRGRVSSWNLRDRHMAETLAALVEHLARTRGEPARVVVWAHNSHLGDARATGMASWGELNLGQLVRERLGADAFLVGFTTYEGTVTAASDWGGAAERKRVRPAIEGSWEELFHREGAPAFALLTSEAEALRRPRLERAIGVVYRPETERASHYFEARIGDQFDAVIHVNATSALAPLERTARWETGELPKTYPTAL